MSAQDDLPFTVERWSAGYERLEETLARVADLKILLAAYEAAVERYPGEPIMARHRARVIKKSMPA